MACHDRRERRVPADLWLVHDNSGEIREISGKFRGTQWNSVGFCVALNLNSVRIPGGFRGNAWFSGKFGVWGGFGRFGASKGLCFCANNHRLEALWARNPQEVSKRHSQAFRPGVSKWCRTSAQGPDEKESKMCQQQLGTL